MSQKYYRGKYTRRTYGLVFDIPWGCAHPKTTPRLTIRKNSTCTAPSPPSWKYSYKKEFEPHKIATIHHPLNFHLRSISRKRMEIFYQATLHYGATQQANYMRIMKGTKRLFTTTSIKLHIPTHQRVCKKSFANRLKERSESYISEPD